jgi:flavin-dependent dehydrogenase/acyl carrier protein
MNKEQKMLNQIVDMVQAILSISRSEIKTNISIQDLGFTSIELVRITDELSEVLNDEIHPGIFFEYSTLEQLNGYLLKDKTEAIDNYLTHIDKITPTLLADSKENNTKEDRIMEQSWSSLEIESLLEETKETNFQLKIEKMPSEHISQKIPVIIGGGISGMLISRKLSQKNIEHVVIGKPVLGDSPRLGESMTELVSIEFTEDLKEYSQYFYSKEVTPFYMGDRVSGLRFNYFKTLHSIFKDDSEEQDYSFIHVDRVGFDQALYNEVSKSKYCHWMEDMVNEVEYDEYTDEIKSVFLSNHKKIVPSFIWDCTNHVRLLGRKIKIPFHNFDDQRHVFFTHYLKKDVVTSCDIDGAPWIHATSLLRAEKAHDGIQGVSWLIPLGDYISVGISMNPEDVGDKTPEEVITLLTKAYQNRGLDYTKYFPRRKEIINIPSQHYAYDRFVGKNWALVGGSGINAWFTSGSNLSIVTCMATMADKIIEQPEVYGEHYTNHTKGFVTTQKVYDALLDSDLGAVDAMKFLSGIVEQSRKRIASYFMYRKGLESDVAVVGKELWQEEVTVDKTYFNYLKQIATHVTPADRKQQTVEIFKKFAEMTQQNKKVTLPYLRKSEMSREKPELFLESLEVTN